MSNIETYIVDSFTDKPFKGNPAGVCLLNLVISEEKMLLIAQEPVSYTHLTLPTICSV